jgi:hypothetical protein
MEEQPRTTFHWDSKTKKHVEIPWEPDKFRRKLNGRGLFWVAFDYKKQMALAHAAHSPLLAVLAELHRLQFQSWKKKEPITFNCSALGFHRDAVIRALRILEQRGWVSVHRERGQSPKVMILEGFRFKD